jgi:hypothetical protein
LNLFSSRYRKEREAFEEMEESDGERVTGSDTVEGTEQRAIQAMPIVIEIAQKSRTRLSWRRRRKGMLLKKQWKN